MEVYSLRSKAFSVRVSLARQYLIYPSFTYYYIVNSTQCKLVISGIDDDLWPGTLGTLVHNRNQQILPYPHSFRLTSSLTFSIPSSGKLYAQITRDTDGKPDGEVGGAQVHIPCYTAFRYQIQTAT